MSNGETVALASRLIAAGGSACTVQPNAPLPSCDWLLFDESIPLSSPTLRAETKRLLAEALSQGHPTLLFLSPCAPLTPKCAVIATELFAYASAAVATPNIATELLGLDGTVEENSEITKAFGDDSELCRMASLAEELAKTGDFVFSMIFDPDEARGVLFASDAYDAITADSIENAIAGLFRAI